MNARTARPVAELIAASQHLAYEVDMLAGLARELESVAQSPGILRNALLESFTVHSRVLLQFFYPTTPHGQDVLSNDYFDDVVAWRVTLGRQPKALAQISGRVAAEIVHLTYTRIALLPEARDWNISEICNAILELVDKFREHAPTDKLAPVWASGTTLTFAVADPAATNSVLMCNSPSVNATFSVAPSDPTVRLPDGT